MFGNLIPWSRKTEETQKNETEHPLTALHREIDHLFNGFMRDDFFPEFAGKGWAGLTAPSFDVSENDKTIEFTGDLPGVEEKDLDISVQNNVLTIKGEKKEEREDKSKEYHVSERHYGSFQRSFTLPDGIDPEHTVASLKKGVLKVTIPKIESAQTQRKKIEIKT